MWGSDLPAGWWVGRVWVLLSVSIMSRVSEHIVVSPPKFFVEIWFRMDEWGEADRGLREANNGGENQLRLGRRVREERIGAEKFGSES